MNHGIVPSALKRGDTIAFISPSVRLNSIFPAALDRAQVSLEAFGYKVKIIFDESIPFHFRREAALKRCEEVHTAFRDPEVKAIICTVGGLHANELLPHLDYGLIKTNPKIFVGYSDITVLHYSIFTQTGLRTFYGPAAITELGEFPRPLQFTLDHLLHVISPDQTGTPVGPIPRSQECDWSFPKFLQDPNCAEARTLEPAPGWKWLRGGKTSGRIFGGCLTSVLHLSGTNYWPDMEGKILLLETAMGDSGTGPFLTVKSRVLMADLVNMGVIGKISGLVLGRPFAHDEKMRREFEEAMLDQCYGTDFPILANVDVGHTTPIVTIPLNAMVRLNSEKDEFTVLETGVR